MHPRDVLQRVKGEMERWEATLDEIRLQAGLGKLELREKRDEFLRSFDESYREARERIEEVRGSAQGELTALQHSLEAGWKELRRTYEELRDRRAAPDDEQEPSRE